ncbi:MAG TPA: DUF6518 family protein [Streptosporangiaceae bacterium]|nr:DUF6518 family protein [Streptosporangiaceae bacterium]
MQSSRSASLVGQPRGDRSAARIAAGVAIGVAVGVATWFAQAHLDLPWAALANSASPWLLSSASRSCSRLENPAGPGQSRSWRPRRSSLPPVCSSTAPR